MATPWSAFLPYVHPEAAGAPVAVVLSKIRHAAQDFCQESQIWRESLDPVVFPKGVKEADLEAPDDDSRIVELVWLKDAGGSKLAPGADYTATHETITLASAPAKAFTCSALAALKPSASAETVLDFLFHDWSEAIAHGALGKLMAMVGREWLSPQGAAFHRQEFSKGVAAARARINKGYASRSLQVSLRRQV
ncbi:MAG: hypothetical protein PWQ57_3313 [Desulfovibrionales bacterium]|nr:hypothetical protein [Desulfovibrionales bacterium]